MLGLSPQRVAGLSCRQFHAGRMQMGILPAISSLRRTQAWL